MKKIISLMPLLLLCVGCAIYDHNSMRSHSDGKGIVVDRVKMAEIFAAHDLPMPKLLDENYYLPPKSWIFKWEPKSRVFSEVGASPGINCNEIASIVVAKALEERKSPVHLAIGVVKCEIPYVLMMSGRIPSIAGWELHAANLIISEDEHIYYVDYGNRVGPREWKSALKHRHFLEESMRNPVVIQF